MPFTPAHVAAVLPLRRKGNVGLPLAALASGSMSPDLPYYFPGGRSWPLAPPPHSALGVISWSLLFGLAMWFVWRLVSPALADLAPDPIRARWRIGPLPSSWWWSVPLAVLIGAATHVGWDEFTHAGRFGATQLAALAAHYPNPLGGSLPGYRYLQYASGLFGLVVVAWVALRTPKWEPPSRRQPRLAAIAPYLVVAGGLISIGVRLAPTWGAIGVRSLAFEASTAFISGAGLTLLGLCILHTVREVWAGEKPIRAAVADRRDGGG